jgi:hypothetical protein
MLEALIAAFARVDEDPRCASKVEHRLIDILVIAVCAVIGEAADSFGGMADDSRGKERLTQAVPCPAHQHCLARYVPAHFPADRPRQLQPQLPELAALGLRLGARSTGV